LFPLLYVFLRIQCQRPVDILCLHVDGMLGWWMESGAMAFLVSIYGLEIHTKRTDVNFDCKRFRIEGRGSFDSGRQVLQR